LYWLHRWSYFDSLVEEFSKVSATMGPNVITLKLGDHTKVIATKDIWLLSNRTIGKFFYTYDQILMLKDLMYSRAQCYIAAGAIYPGNDEIIRAITETIKWHEKCLYLHRNKGFEILKQTEALAKAYLSEMTDPIFVVNGPYPRMIEKIRAKEKDLGSIVFLVDEFDTVLRSMKDIQSVVEIFGLLKISGHPIIDPKVGGKSAAKEARDQDATLWGDAVKLDWEFKRSMLMSYIAKHGRWPDLEFTHGSPKTKLRSYYIRQFRGLNRSSYPLQDWQYCRFKKIAEFDYSPNYLDLLDDKAISLYRTNVAASWNPTIKPKSHRRLLIELINRETLDIKSIVMMIVRREVPFDWFIVSLHPKEREFKLAPRMFSMLVLEIRIFFALTEANLADHIFPYLPQQTMTKSKIAINRQFLEMTKISNDSESLRMFIEIDLSRWNLRWREMAVNPVARTLNDMFGVVGVFDFCHEFFSQSMIVVRVSDLPPDGIEDVNPPESDLLWYNHLGGFEGICQKLWTICTYSMIALAVTELPLSYILVGQGDNQILSIVTGRDPVRSDTEVLEELRDTVTSRVSDMCSSVNQEVKVEECLESTTVITYSKDIYVSGVYRPTSLKFHSRLFPHSSQIFPSVRTNLGAIFSTAVAGAEKSDQPMSSYYLACLYGALYLFRTAEGRGPYGAQLSWIKRHLKLRFLDFVAFCLTLPSELGGFPTIPFLGFTYKGGSDPLGKSISSMTILGLHSDSRLMNRMLSQLDSDVIYNASPRIGALFMDPFSIPLKKPPTAIDGIARETTVSLHQKIKTKEIYELMGADTSSYLDALVFALSSCTPMNPLIMRDILDCSVAGVTDTISRMFVATRTLQSVVRTLGVPIVENVLHLECRGILYMHQRFEQLPNNPASAKSIYTRTTECRNRWFPSQASPIVGLTTYQPWDFDIAWGTEGLNQEGINAVLIADNDPLETRGQYDPYVGSKTREKRSEHGFKIVGTDSASRSMRKLQLISSQTGNDPIFRTIIDVVGWSRTNTQLSKVSDLLTATAGGTLSHRYAARAGHQDAFNIGSPNFATHCVVSTDNTGYLSGGVLDYPLMFQEFLLTSLWCLQIRFLETRDLFEAITILTSNRTITPLPDVVIKGPDSIELPVLRYAINPLAFIPSLHLERVAGAIAHPSLPTTDIFVPSTRLRLQVLEAYMRSILRRYSTGRQIADGSLQHFQGATLDIAELASNTLQVVCESIKAVICDEAISNYMMTAAVGRRRWKVDTFAFKITPVLVSCISPLLGHPLINKDPLVRVLKLYDNPTYAGGFSSPHQRLVGYINGMIMTALKGADNAYNHRPVGIFTSDNNRTVSDSLFSCLLSDFYIWHVKNMIPWSTVQSVLGKQLIPIIRSQPLETDRVFTLYRSIANMTDQFNMLYPSIAQTLQDYTKQRLQGYKCTVPDMLKSTRSIDSWGLPTLVQAPKSSTLRIPHGLPKPDSYSFQKCHHQSTGVRVLGLTNTYSTEILLAAYGRNRSRRGLGANGALSFWLQFAPLLKSKPVITVGCGLGAVARVALDNGCPHVFGIDLRSTIPLKSHRFRSYKPPLVMASEYNENYTQLPESITTSGNWLDRTVVEKVLQYDQGDSTLVIDIQQAHVRFGLETLVDAFQLKSRGTIMLRTYVTELEAGLLCSDLSISDCTFRTYSVSQNSLLVQLLIVIKKWPRELKIAVVPKFMLKFNPVIISQDSSASVVSTSLSISDAIFNTVFVAPNQTVEDVSLALGNLLEESKGDYDSRFSYNQWTIYLRAKAVCDWALMNPEAQEAVLEHWKSTTEMIVVTHHGRFPVQVGWSFFYHLATYGARIAK